MPSNSSISRRGFALGAMLLAPAVTLPFPALALDDKEASDLIGQLVSDLNKIINSGKAETAMFRDFENLFNKYADVPIIARSSLGAPWRSATSAQKSSYTSAFRGYMARKYGRRFNEFKGGNIVVNSSRQVKSGFLVSSTVHISSSAPFAVDWQVSDKSGANKMFNLYIEGISLLATERTEISAMLDKRGGDLDVLIRDLKSL